MSIDIATILGQKWARDQKQEAQYHIHPEGQEGASNLGGCIALRSKKEAGIPLPQKEGAKADFGAAFVGDVWHKKIQVDLVQELSKTYLRRYVGPVIKEDGIPQEIVIETEIIPGHKIVSPVDLCVVTAPGFSLVEIPYKNTTKMAYIKHPDAKWVFIADIKTASPFSYNLHEKEGLGEEYESQGLAYLKATGLSSMPFLFLNKINAHRFTTILQWSVEKWKALQDKRYRELALANNIKQAIQCDFVDSDFKYFTSDAEYICAYCNLSETHEVDINGTVKVVLDKPCIEVVTRVEKEYEQKFRPNTPWMSGMSMLTIDRVNAGIVYAHNKGGKVFEDTVFHAAKTYVEGWVKEISKPVVKPKIPLAYEDNAFSQPKPIVKEEVNPADLPIYGNPKNECMKCGKGGANPGSGQCKKCDDAEEKEFIERSKPVCKLLPPDPEDIVLPHKETDEEALKNINSLGITCTLCNKPRMAGQQVCEEHYRKIGEAIKNL